MKGSTHIDWVIALAIMLSFMAFSFYYMSYLSTPTQPFEETLRTQAFQIAKNLIYNVSWTVYKVPIIVESENISSDHPVEVYFKVPENTNENSVIMLDSNSEEIANQYENNTIMFTGNLSNTKNKFYLVYIKNASLSQLNYSTDLTISSLTVNNLKINATFGTSGISSLLYGGTELLYGTGVDLKTSETPVITNGSIRAKINYTGLDVKIYKNNSRITFSSSQAFSPDIYLDDDFTSFYNGSANTFDGTGSVCCSGTFNLIDFYSTNGLAIVGGDMSITVDNQNSYRKVTLTSVTSFEIYVHDGDYTNALSEVDMYLNTSTLAGIPEEITGVSIDNLNTLGALDYTDLKNLLETGSGFNLTVENVTNIGKTIPDDRTVIVIPYPMNVVGRYANLTKTNFDVAVWMEAS